MIFIKLTNADTKEKGFHSALSVQHIELPDDEIIRDAENAKSIVTFAAHGDTTCMAFEETPEEVEATIREALSQSDQTLVAAVQLATALANDLADYHFRGDSVENVEVKVTLPNHG